MTLSLQKSDAFLHDFALQALWYVREAGDEVARDFQIAVDARLRLLCTHPGLGRLRSFQHPKLHALRSFPLDRPFDRILLFYRVSGSTLQVVRIMHGARDLPNRLAE